LCVHSDNIVYQGQLIAV